MVRALITGGSGFVGAWLAAHLREGGDEVVSIDIETDVADPEALAPVMAAAAPDAVYHLAALSHVGQSWEAPIEVLRVNVLGTASVLAVARSLPRSPTVLVVSSAEVYGAVQPDALPLREETSAVAPVSPYAVSKAACEQLALQAWRAYGQPVVVVRPFNHIGPGQAPNFAVSAFARRIVEANRRGLDALAVGTLTARRDFTDVRDVVRAYRLLITRGVPGTIYNVCSGTDCSLRDVADTLMELVGVDLRLVTDPALVRPVEVPVLRGDPARLQAATGWKPELPLEDTLRAVIEYWEQHPEV